MLIELLFYSALTALSSAQYPGSCPSTTIAGLTGAQVPICCSGPHDNTKPVMSKGSCILAATTTSITSRLVTCSIGHASDPTDLEPVTFKTGSFGDAAIPLDITIAGSPGSSSPCVADVSCDNNNDAIPGGAGSVLRNAAFSYNAGALLTFYVGVGREPGGRYTSVSTDDDQAIAAGGGSASAYNSGANGGSTTLMAYDGPFSAQCAPGDLGFAGTGHTGVTDNVPGAGSGGSGLLGGNGGVICDDCSAAGAGNCPSGGAGGSNAETLGFTASTTLFSKTAAYASISFTATCGCGNGFTPNSDATACECVSKLVDADGICSAPAITPVTPPVTPVTPPVTPVTPPVTKNSTDPVVLPNSTDIPVVPSNTTDSISSLQPTSDVTPLSSTPSSSATPISITPVTPGGGTPTTSADSDCPTCVDYAPPAIISPTVKTAVAQGATASNLVISGASPLSIGFAPVFVALSFFAFVH